MERPVPPAAPRRRFPVVVGLVGVLLVASLTCAGLALRSHASDGSASPPTTLAPRRAVAIAFVDVEGGVTSLYPLKPGRVAEVWAEEGKEVPAGARLFRMESVAEEKQVEEARLALQAAQEKVAQAQQLLAQHQKAVVAQRKAIDLARVAVKEASKTHEKAERFYREGLGGSAEDVAIAAVVVEKAEAAVAVEEAKLAATEAGAPTHTARLAEINVQAKEKLVEKAEYALNVQTVKAPVKGEVLRSSVRVGEVLGPSPRQPALLFCPSGQRIVRAEVEQEFAGRVELGQTARIQDDSTGGGDWRGKVIRVSDWYSHRRSIILEPLQFNDVRTLECIIRLEGGSKTPLRIGQRVRVMLEGRE